MQGRHSSYNNDEKRYSESECNSNLAPNPEIETEPPAAGIVGDGI